MMHLITCLLVANSRHDDHRESHESSYHVLDSAEKQCSIVGYLSMLDANVQRKGRQDGSEPITKIAKKNDFTPFRHNKAIAGFEMADWRLSYLSPRW